MLSSFATTFQATHLERNKRQIQQLIATEISSLLAADDREFIRRRVRASGVKVCRQDQVLLNYWNAQTDKQVNALTSVEMPKFAARPRLTHIVQPTCGVPMRRVA